MIVAEKSRAYVLDLDTFFRDLWNFVIVDTVLLNSSGH
jgi:hypothetical protein